MKLCEQTWEQVTGYLKKHNELIIPIGTCEQHGKHLPISTDTIIAEYFADYLSKKTGIIIAPTVNYGVNTPCDRLISGTTSISESTLKQTVSEIINWWKDQGFKKFYCISAHGDIFHIRAIKKSNPRFVEVLELFRIDYKNILQKQDECEHACEAETSVMLYLFPTLVIKSRVEDYYASSEEIQPRIEHKNPRPLRNCPGSVGFPSFATKEKGQLIIDRMRRKSLEWIKK